jgi:rhodanese-related sulfurtransferase
MKKFISYFMLAVILPAFIITGCKDKTDPIPAEKGNFKTLTTYMSAHDLDLPALLAGWVIAPKLTTEDGGIVEPDGNTIPTYHVFDIRSADLYNAGHIPGAINVALTEIVTKAADYKDKPILVVCKTGQTAGRGVMALRLSGFPDAKVMKFGMSYWNETYDLWSGNIGDNAVDSPNWVNDASADLPINDYPQWETTSTDGAEILAANVATMLAASGWGVSSDDVLADPAAHKIYNFWTTDDYTTFGHFKGAYQFKPISIANDLVYSLPTSDECLVYCFTGQTSSFITAWLQVLGYNAKSILFGVNKLQHTALDAAGKPAWHHSFDYVSETK